MWISSVVGEGESRWESRSDQPLVDGDSCLSVSHSKASLKSFHVIGWWLPLNLGAV